MSRKPARNNLDGVISSIIGSDARLEGNLSLEGAIRIDGKFKGTLVCNSTVTAGSKSVIEGSIDAKEVILGGKVEGTLIARSRLVLESTASLSGEMATCSLIIEEGAQFSGISAMGNTAVEQLLAKQGNQRAIPGDGNQKIVLFSDDDDTPDDNREKRSRAKQIS